MDKKTKRRESRYKRLFGITVEEYETMLAHQNGVCAICHRPPVNYRLSVDHDHKTGAVRGLLCMVCNKRLNERITIEWLENAAQYMLHPPVNSALGRIPQGRIGRVTKRHRKTKIRKVVND